MSICSRNSPEKKQKLRRLSSFWLCEAINRHSRKEAKKYRFGTICDDFAVAFYPVFIPFLSLPILLIFFWRYLEQKLTRNSPEKKKKEISLLFSYCLNSTPSALRISLKFSENAVSRDFSSSDTLALCWSIRFGYFPDFSSSTILFFLSAISSSITFTTGLPLRITGALRSLKVSTVALLGILDGIPVIFGLKVSSCSISTHIERQP